MMPKIIELKQVPVVLVELNKEREVDSWIKLGSPIIIDYPNKVIGKLSDLTEEQFAECVDIDVDYGVVIYRNYRTTSMPYYDEQINAKQSFLSLLESENVYTENPHDYMLQSTEENFDNCKCGKTELQIVREKWGQAQRRTIDPKRTVVLLRKGETK